MIRRKYQWRLGTVLLAGLLLALLRPVLAQLLGDRWASELLFSIVIVAVLVLLIDRRQYRKTAIVLALLALTFVWIGHAFSGSTGTVLFLIGVLLQIIFFGYALFRILQSILSASTTGNTLTAAVCGYLLLGIIWGDIYVSLAIVSPESFSTGDQFRAAIEQPQENTGVYEYLSFVTLTTLGYGDITPVSETARNLAWIEAMTGQLYLAIFIAGLVGQRLAERRRKESLGE